MNPDLPTLIPNLVAAFWVIALGLYVSLRRPPRALWPVLPAYLFCVLLYLLGDGITLVSSDMLWEQIGIAILYSGSFPAAAACWLLAVRYAEAEGSPFAWARGPWIWVPLLATGLSWLGMMTNPWHGQFVTPVIGDHNVHHWLWHATVPVGYVLVYGSIVLYARLAWRTSEASVRTNALIMASGILITLVSNFVSYQPSVGPPFDLTVAGLGTTCALFLFGTYRTRLFSLLPIALTEVIRHDPAGLVLVDLEGRCLDANPAADELLCGRLDRPGRDVMAVLAHQLEAPDGTRPGRDELQRRLLQSPRATSESLGPLRGPSGRWLRLTATPIPRREGRAQTVSIRIQDQSAEYLAEQALREAHDELETRVSERTADLAAAVSGLTSEMKARREAESGLRRTNERYRRISDLRSDLSFAFTVDADGEVSWEWSTDAIMSLTGYASSELSSEAYLHIVHPDDRSLLAGVRDRAVRGEVVRCEYRIRKKSGETRWLELFAQAQQENGGFVVVGVVSDVTERKRAEVERLALERRVEEADRRESLGVMAAGLAHDFNNVLTVILGNVSLAELEIDAGDVAWQRLGRIRSAGQFGVKLTEQLLTYAGKSSITAERFDLGPLVLETLDLLRASATPKVEVVVEIEDHPPGGGALRVEGDPTQIRQILVNLVSNASEAMGEAGGCITIRVGRGDMPPATAFVGEVPDLDSEWVRLEVADDGPGIEDETRRHVFEPFFTKRQGGRGLGLAVVHGIVKAHGAAIELESEPGSGACFRVSFPRNG